MAGSEQTYTNLLFMKYHRLCKVARIIMFEMNMDVLFEIIADQANRIMETERCTAFLYDEGREELWSLVATGIKKNEIRIPATYGLAGWVFQNRKSLVISDVSADPRFYGDVDRKSGFHTRNMVCIPLVNQKRRCIGAFQALNKRSGDFTDGDLELLHTIRAFWRGFPGRAGKWGRAAWKRASRWPSAASRGFSASRRRSTISFTRRP